MSVLACLLAEFSAFATLHIITHVWGGRPKAARGEAAKRPSRGVHMAAVSGVTVKHRSRIAAHRHNDHGVTALGL